VAAKKARAASFSSSRSCRPARREAGVAHDGETEVPTQHAQHLPRTGEHRGRQHEEGVCPRIGRRGHVLARLAWLHGGTLEDPAEAVVRGVAAMLLAPPPLGFTP